MKLGEAMTKDPEALLSHNALYLNRFKKSMGRTIVAFMLGSRGIIFVMPRYQQQHWVGPEQQHYEILVQVGRLFSRSLLHQ